MKTAIIHPFMDNIGGAEKLVLTLAKGLDAQIITTNIDKANISKMGFKQCIKSIGRVPKNAPLRHQKAVWLFSRYKGNYDYYIIAGDWALSAAINNKPNLWYVHSPTRELWDLYKHTRKNLVAPALRYIYDAWVQYNRHLQRKHARHAGVVLCNSQNTKKRLVKYLNIQAKVVHPPVDTQIFKFQSTGDYWLSVNRMIPHKRVELQIEAFRKLPQERLVIVGSFEHARQFTKYRQKIYARLPPNVTLLNHLNEKELAKLYANCRGFITTSKDEDFGMTAIEAMSAGKAVIAPNEGGYKESIIHKRTGLLIQPKESMIINAIKKVNQDPEQYRQPCQERAQAFCVQAFIDKVTDAMQK